jgi:hypothetical protein
LFVPLSRLQAGFGRLTDAQAAIAYEVSAYATRGLLDRIGPAGLPLLLQGLRGGQSLEDAMAQFGFTFDLFEADLARRLNAPLRREPVQ